MSHSDGNTDWGRIIRDMIARSTDSAPTEPGVYRMPCGNCYVDFFLASDQAHYVTGQIIAATGNSGVA